MPDENVRVRIAPSPSGYLHVGTARMAISNFLFARHYGGQFLVRIEDTDTERSDHSLVEPILSALAWLGIESDEEVVFQSQRAALHSKAAVELLEGGDAYRCFCSKEQLEKDREEAKKNKTSFAYNRRCFGLTEDEIKSRLDAGESFVIRLKIPDGETTFDDMVGGTLKRQNTEIEDLIIARSDGSATYNLAVVIDDHDMNITHIIRGNDHITNTFKQIHIYRAFKWDTPIFGHLPIILRPDKRKVSKRLGDKDVAQYRDEGILPQAMFNCLSLLNWSPKNDEEIFTVDELISIFTEKNFNPSNAVFDEEKLEAFNKAHIARMSDHDLATIVAPMLVEADLTTKYWLETRWEYLRGVVGLLKDRARRVSDFVEMGGYFFTFDYKYDPEAAAQQFNSESAEWLAELADRFESLEQFKHDDIAGVLGELADEKGIKKARLIHPTRLAVSGGPVGPSLYAMLELLSAPIVVERMRHAANYIREKVN